MAENETAAALPRSALSAALRGLRGRCPACGEGRLFARYLKVADRCPACGEALHHQRADDAPPYVVIIVLGHLIVGLILSIEVAYRPPIWVHMAVFLPLTLVLALLMLQPVKGALVGVQWALRMHGFGDEAPRPAGSIPERPAGS